MLLQLNLQRFGDDRMKCKEVFWKSQKLSANRGKLHQTPLQENKAVSASGFRPRSWARFTIHTFPVWSNKGHRQYRQRSHHVVFMKSRPIADPVFVLRGTCCPHKSPLWASESWPPTALYSHTISQGKLVLGNKPTCGPHLSYTSVETAGRQDLHTRCAPGARQTAGRPAETTWGPGSASCPCSCTAGPRTARRRRLPGARRRRHAGRC